MSYLELGGKGRKDWINRGEDGATVAAGDQEVGDGSHDENLGLGSNLLKGAVQVDEASAVNDLGRLHAVPRSDI